VQSKLDDARSDHRQHIPLPDERLTVGEFLDQWLEEFVKSSAAPRTLESYTEITVAHIKPLLGRIPLAKLSPLDVQRLVNEKMTEREPSKDGNPRKKLSPRTVRYIHAILRSALNRAVEWGFAKRNVALKVRLPKASKPRHRPLDEREAVSFLEVVNGDRLEAAYSVAVALGLREGEVLGLRWGTSTLTPLRSRSRRLSGDRR
jgi:integrase